MAKNISVRMDNKGRLTLPRSIRETLHAEPGDVFYIQPANDGSLRLVRAVNPFDALADEALGEYEDGETLTLEQFASQEDISLEDK